MFTKCEPCRYLTQVTFQTLSMDIKVLLTFCIIVGISVAEDDLPIKSQHGINPFPSCISKVLSKEYVRKPLRARFFQRNFYDSKKLEGCAMRIPNTPIETGDDSPVKQRCLLQLSQQLSPNLKFTMNIRLDVYAETKYNRPLDIVLVLHSLSGYTWTLSVENLALAVSTKRTSNLTILFTHKDSKLALEQIQLPRWRITIDYVKPDVKDLKSFNQISSWAESLFNGAPLNLNVNFPSKFSHSSGTTSDFDIINSVDLTIPNNGGTRREGKKICIEPLTSENAYKRNHYLSQWVKGRMDASIDDGYTSCHTENVWAPDQNSVEKSKPGGQRSSESIKLLQSIEIADNMMKQVKADQMNIQLRVQNQRVSVDNTVNKTYILIILNKNPKLSFTFDLRGLFGKLHIHTNMNQTFKMLNGFTDYVIKVNSKISSPELFLEYVMRLQTPTGNDFSSWQVERVTISRIPHISIQQSIAVFLDISLSSHPLKLSDLENLVVLQCFNTEDLSISLNAKTFENVGLKREWVRLGKERCMFSDSGDGKWVRKLLLRTGNNICGTHRSNEGENVSLTNKIYIVCPLNMSKGLAPFPLNVQCDYAISSNEDFPPIIEENISPQHMSVWGTWNGKKYAGPLPSQSSNMKGEITMDLYTDAAMGHNDKIVFDNRIVRSGQELYAYVRPKDDTINYGLMVRDCYLSNDKKKIHPLGFPRQYLIIKGCDMGVSFKWISSDSYRYKKFSFVLPRLNFFAMSSYIYLHCNVQACNYAKTPVERINGLPKCWNQNFLCKVPSTPATTHLISVTLKKDEKEKDLSPGKYRPEVLHRNSRSIVKTVPLWGAVIIATIAFLLGIVFTYIMWYIHHNAGSHCEVGDRFLNRRRNRDHRRSNGASGRCYGNKNMNSKLPTTTRAPHCQQFCLHRLMPHNYLDDRHAIIREDTTDEAVARLLSNRGIIGSPTSPQGYPHTDGKEDGLFEPSDPETGTRVKNSHSISCTVCGEGGSSGFGTGNCSSCSAQTCSLGDENEPLRILPPDLGQSPTSKYEQQQQQLYASNFTSV